MIEGDTVICRHTHRVRHVDTGELYSLEEFFLHPGQQAILLGVVGDEFQVGRLELMGGELDGLRVATGMLEFFDKV